MTKREITIGHSPDADDAFMFYALANDKIDPGPFSFRHILLDIETLNHKAAVGELDITAISVHAYSYVHHRYALLTAGSSMGEEYGPMVVAREPMSIEEVKTKTIAVPGKMTSAFLGLNLAIGEFNYDVTPFDQIIPAVVDGRVDAGLIIHEGQLFYGDKGLHKILDLGEWWAKENAGLPLPLGSNAIRKDLGDDLIAELAPYMKKTIEYSLTHREEALAYAMKFSRDLPTEKADKFVGMYVNDLTLHLGDNGKKAYQLFLDKGYNAGLIPNKVELEFVDCG
jgi:5,8-dihydroxy-2-naphthoate synthase